jgi:hypothetical protein
MTKKRSMTLNLNEAEMQALDEIGAKKDLSKTGVIRQALKLYIMIDARLEQGERLFFEDEETKTRSEFILL